jgi:hypothetical protein
MRCRRWGHLEVSPNNYTLGLQLIELRGIHRSSTSASDSASTRGVDVVGAGTFALDYQGDA